MSSERLDDSPSVDREGEHRATLAVGNKAIYPGQGPCRIGRVVKRVIGGRQTMFYHLTLLDDSGAELFVPVEKADAIGLRLPLKRSEIPKLLGNLKKRFKTHDGWKQRAIANSKLLASGSAFALCEVVASLTELSNTGTLTLGESSVLGKARRLLVREISEVMGETETVAEEKVEQALRARKKNETHLAIVSESATGPLRG
jgi:CarD family transcriptional regulator, regulator of rRNA transcription